MEFRFYNYIFSDKLDSLFAFLSENSYEYKIIDNQIFFHLENEFCKKKY